MDSTASASIPSFLVPAAIGVRSRRHRVVLRRTENHLQEVKDVLDTILVMEEPRLNLEQRELISTKMMHIKYGAEELSRYVAAHPRTSIEERVDIIKIKADILQQLMRGKLVLF